MKGLIGQNYLPSKFGFWPGKHQFRLSFAAFGLMELGFDLWNLYFASETQTFILGRAQIPNQNQNSQGENENENENIANTTKQRDLTSDFSLLCFVI